MFRLLPVNGHDMRKEQQKLIFDLTKIKKRAGLCNVPPQAAAWFNSAVAPAVPTASRQLVVVFAVVPLCHHF
jgi:hypothetical protein